MPLDTAVILPLLAAIVALFSQALQIRLRKWLHQRPARLFLIPTTLASAFLFVLAAWSALGWAIALMITAYCFVPAAIAYRNGPGDGRFQSGRLGATADLAIILLLWLPLELAAGAALIPEPFQGTARAIAYGVAILLALSLFLLFRNVDGMRYRLPSTVRDFVIPLAGLILSLVILIPLALWTGFMPPFHVPADLTAGVMLRRFLLTVAGVALPEEILFRGLIQNWIMQRFGENNRSLALAAVVFGAAHLNNAPGGFPNWRYMFLAIIAGFIYGKVFQKTSTILASTAVHAGVNTLKFSFFR